MASRRTTSSVLETTRLQRYHGPVLAQILGRSAGIRISYNEEDDVYRINDHADLLIMYRSHPRSGTSWEFTLSTQLVRKIRLHQQRVVPFFLALHCMSDDEERLPSRIVYLSETELSELLFLTEDRDNQTITVADRGDETRLTGTSGRDPVDGLMVATLPAAMFG